MLGKQKIFSNVYLVKDEVASLGQLRKALRKYSLTDKPNWSLPEVSYILPSKKGFVRITMGKTHTEELGWVTELTVDRTYKRLPSEIKRLLEIIHAEEVSSSTSSLVERLEDALRETGVL